jgi:hypothetical protein
MNKKMLLVFGLILIVSVTLFGQYEKANPADVSQLFSMACVFNKGISEKTEITIFIYKDDPTATALKTFEGQKMGNATVKSIVNSTTAPTAAPDILFIGNDDKADELIDYCNANSILCLTSLPDVVKQGASLGIGLSNGNPTLLLNPNGVAAQSQNFNPAIMKMAKIHK